MSTSHQKTALVTGGGRGIGRATAYALAAAGYNIALNDVAGSAAIDETLAGIRARGARAEFFEQDIANVSAHAALVQNASRAFGPIHCLVNNAGVQVAERKDILETTADDFDRVLGINLRGSFFLTQAVARKMIADDPRMGGRTIVTITSANAVMASPEKASYCLSKAGLSMAVQLFAARLADHGISAFEIRPGLIRTDMTAAVRESYGNRIENGLTLVKRWGEPDEVAHAISSLATGALPYSTGQVVNIDGGLLVQRL